MHVFEHSLWGVSVGLTAIITPIFFALTFVLIARLTDRNWVILGLQRGARHPLRRGERRVVVAFDPEPRGLSGDAVPPRAGMPAPAVRARCGRARRPDGSR